MIELRSVCKRYPDSDVPGLDGVDLRVEPGEVVLLSGATGAGKSTLLGLLYAAHFADAGMVSLFDRDLVRLRRSSVALLRRCVGIVSQTLDLLDDRPAVDNVALAVEVAGESRRRARIRALAALDALGMAKRAAQPVAALSLGQRQLVALARATVGEPTALIADEPSAYLDNDGRELLIATLAAAQERGAAAVVATGDHKLLCAGAHRSWRHLELVDGRLQVIADRRPVHFAGDPGAAADIDDGDSEIIAIEVPAGASGAVSDEMFGAESGGMTGAVSEADRDDAARDDDSDYDSFEIAADEQTEGDGADDSADEPDENVLPFPIAHTGGS